MAEDKKDSQKMEEVVSLAKRRGFIYPGSDLYGGLANTYDYGPQGVELLKNIKDLWWENFVRLRDDIVGLDGSLISHSKVWDASGHTSGFTDAMIDCKSCKKRYRADHVIEDYLDKLSAKKTSELSETFLVPHIKDLTKIKTALSQRKVEGLTEDEFDAIINFIPIHCSNCRKLDWTKVRRFNLLFPVSLGIVEGGQNLAYLRGETAQGMFINFTNIVNSTRVRLPFGIAQMGKSFRNEITLGNSVFRTVEFEQGEIEYFFNPEKSKWENLFESWKKDMWIFVTEVLGIKSKNLRWREHTDEERSFYSKKTEDLEYNFPFGFKELWGLAYRTDYDLKQHQKYSGKDLTIQDPHSGDKVLPHVIEPAVGINRLFLMALVDAYENNDKRTVLHLDPKLAPFKAAVFPLLSNKEQLVEKAREVYNSLKLDFPATFDDRGNIGKRYLYQDEIGTPWCVTVDFETLEDQAVTVRDRDTMEQKRIKISELNSYISAKLTGK